MSKKSFTISIGEYGVVVALHEGNSVKNKILLSSLNDGHKPQLIELFNSNKKIPTYLLIDTNNQTYKRKSYPLVREFDFRRIAKRDSEKENDSTEKSFKNFYYVKNKLEKKWDCTFVSTLESEEISKWEEFLMSLPNDFVGIFMLPIETYHLAKVVFDIAKSEQKTSQSKDQIISFIIQNKVSGLRQTIFYNQTIVFTRVVHYDFENKNFPERFEQDLFRSGEYLKMIFPNLKMQDITIINVLSDEITEKVKYRNNDLKLINYSPFEIAKKLKIKNAIATNNSNFSDVLIANFFANNRKKVLKFLNSRIGFLSKLHLFLKSILVFNGIIILGILLLFGKIVTTKQGYDQEILNLNETRIELEKKLHDVSDAALDINNQMIDNKENLSLSTEEKNVMANKIVDFGKINDLLLSINNNPVSEVFNQMVFIQKYGAVADSFVYQLSDFNSKSTSISNKRFFYINGTISDSSGDIEVLFKKFDSMSLDAKTIFPEYNIKYSELSKNVDFSKKYYSFPFDLNLESK